MPSPPVDRIRQKYFPDRLLDCRTLLSTLEALPAYGQHGEALRDLSENMLSDSFATGDLGEARQESPPESPMSDDLAATMLAKASRIERPDESQTKDITPPGVKESPGAHRRPRCPLHRAAYRLSRTRPNPRPAD